MSWQVVAPQGANLELAGLSGPDAWQLMLDTARLVAGSGYDRLWLQDRTDTLPRREREPVIDGWTGLAAVATAVPDLQLGLLSPTAPFRNVGLLAKHAATVDLLSGGRLSVGFETRAQLPELAALGLADSAAEVDLVGTVQALRLLWSGDSVDYLSTGATLERAHSLPIPQQARLPLVVRSPAAHAAELAEEILIECSALQWTGELAEVAAAIAAVDERRERLDLDPAGLRHQLFAEARVFDSQLDRDRWFSTPHVVVFWSHHPDLLARRSLYGTVEQVSERAQEYSDVGVSDFVLWFRDYPELTSLTAFAETVIPQVQPAAGRGEPVFSADDSDTRASANLLSADSGSRG